MLRRGRNAFVTSVAVSVGNALRVHRIGGNFTESSCRAYGTFYPRALANVSMSDTVPMMHFLIRRTRPWSVKRSSIFDSPS